MSYQVLARKWRPRRFGEMVGQEHVLRALVNALDTGRLHHAYLFTGTRGVGKTSLARVVAKALNCETGVSSNPCGVCSACVEIDEGRFMDLIEVDAASRTKVEETRELLDNVQYAPSRGRYKVYLIDEVHMFSGHSFNALLKTLEEPPPHVKFLLATTDPRKLPVTVLSRCLQFNLTRLTLEQLRGQIRLITSAEGIPAEAGAIDLIAGAADGSVRDALSLLDQAIAFGGGELREQDVSLMLGTVGARDIARMLRALAAKDARAVIDMTRELARGAADFGQILNHLLSLLSRVAVHQALGSAVAVVEDDPEVGALAAALTPEECQLFYQIGLIGRRDLHLAPDPQVGFEMTLLRMLAFCPAATAAALPVPATRRSATPITPPGGDAAAPRPAPVEPGPPGTTPGGGATALDWIAVVESLDAAGLVRELGRNCALRSFDGECVELVIAPQYENLRADRHVRALEAALRQRLQTHVRVRLVVAEVGDLVTPSVKTLQDQAARQREAEEQMERDPVIERLKATFGATIESVSLG